MKQGGLDTLAALCGGASKARTHYAEQNNTSAANARDPKQEQVSEGEGKEMTQRIDPALSPGIPMAPSLTQPTQTSVTAANNVIAAPTTEIPTQINSTLQQWQALTPPAPYAVPNQAAATAAMASILQAAIQNPMRMAQPTDPNSLNALQQIAYYQYMATAQAQQITQAQRTVPVFAAPPVAHPAGVIADQNVSTAHSFVFNQNASQVQATVADESKKRMTSQHPQQAAQQTQYVIPSASTASTTSRDSPPSSQKSTMQPPPPPSQVQTLPSALSTCSFGSASSHRPIAPTSSKLMPLKSSQATIVQRPVLETNTSMPLGDKKQLKRAANRRSAQLSRKRKKAFIEELKEENDELRRKEQILKSIPDLIVVFDSAGKLWFVSHSVNRFLNFTPSELEGSSFWDRLCDESVRLLKAAFMDALAARKNDMDTTPLGSGVWELRLVDNDGSHKVVTLNGVVHFSGDAPECVCSIRPRDDNKTITNAKASEVAQDCIKVLATKTALHTVIKPNQSVIASSGGKNQTDSDVQIAKGRASLNPPTAANGNGRLISDGDSGSVISESIVSESGSE